MHPYPQRRDRGYKAHKPDYMLFKLLSSLVCSESDAAPGTVTKSDLFFPRVTRANITSASPMISVDHSAIIVHATEEFGKELVKTSVVSTAQ